jgi:hypothetical protein
MNKVNVHVSVVSMNNVHVEVYCTILSTNTDTYTHTPESRLAIALCYTLHYPHVNLRSQSLSDTMHIINVMHIIIHVMYNIVLVNLRSQPLSDTMHIINVMHIIINVM